MRRISEFVEKQYLLPIVRNEEVQDKEITVEGTYFLSGDYGEYAVSVVVMPDGSKALWRTGATAIVQALKRVKEENAFPILATVRKRGKSWYAE